METTTHIPEDMIQDLEKIIYKKPRFSQPGHSSTTMLRGGGSFNVHRIKTRITALPINTLQRPLEPGTSSWRKLTEFFLTVAKTKQSKICFADGHTINHIDRISRNSTKNY